MTLPDHLTASLSTRYRLDRELGGGGMASVYLATELALGREVVIKVLDGGDTPAAVERFTREIRLVAQLQHPNIVGAVVEGSVRRLGNRVRVSAELLDAGNGSQLWADRYDRDASDLFALQDDIAREVAGALQTTLTRQPGPQAVASVTPEPVNPQAYNLYLQASHLCRGQTMPRITRTPRPSSRARSRSRRS